VICNDRREGRRDSLVQTPPSNYFNGCGRSSLVTFAKCKWHRTVLYLQVRVMLGDDCSTTLSCIRLGELFVVRLVYFKESSNTCPSEEWMAADGVARGGSEGRHGYYITNTLICTAFSRSVLVLLSVFDFAEGDTGKRRRGEDGNSGSEEMEWCKVQGRFFYVPCREVPLPSLMKEWETVKNGEYFTCKKLEDEGFDAINPTCN
jgi:hypothetical protein